jgi:hypothetical protein
MGAKRKVAAAGDITQHPSTRIAPIKDQLDAENSGIVFGCFAKDHKSVTRSSVALKLQSARFNISCTKLATASNARLLSWELFKCSGVSALQFCLMHQNRGGG